MKTELKPLSKAEKSALKELKVNHNNHHTFLINENNNSRVQKVSRFAWSSEDML